MSKQTYTQKKSIHQFPPSSQGQPLLATLLPQAAWDQIMAVETSSCHALIDKQSSQRKSATSSLTLVSGGLFSRISSTGSELRASNLAATGKIRAGVIDESSQTPYMQPSAGGFCDLLPLRDSKHLPSRRKFKGRGCTF